jgi:uncharacterized protein
MKHTPTSSILISGGSGLIGTSLVRCFSVRRIPMLRLVRGNADTPAELRWNPDALEPVANLSLLEDTAAAIHLSGANLSAHRWTEAYKREIVESRLYTTRALVDLLKRLERPPRSLLCASAVGIYGDREDETLTESALPGQGFLADTCRAWEAEADRASEAGIRVVHLRFGVVLSPEGGALKQMLPVFRAGIGGPLASGRQWMSWVMADDLVRAVLHILDGDSLTGPVNLVSPIPVTNADFTRALGRALRRPAALRVPRFALRAALGEIADAAVLPSTRAIPERLAHSGFHFDFPEIYDALRSVL